MVFDDSPPFAWRIAPHSFITCRMRLGVLSRGLDDLDWMRRLGFRSTQWMRFDESPAAPPHADWKPFAEKFAAQAKAADIRISAIGALYQNPLDSRQT